MKPWGTLPLRVVLGAIYIAYGLHYAFGMFGGTGIEGYAQDLAGVGLTPGSMWAYILAYAQLIGGILLLIGLFTRTVSGILMVIVLLLGIKFHLFKGFFIANGGIEYTLLQLGALLALVISGAGKFVITAKT